MEVVGRAGALDVEVALEAGPGLVLGLLERRVVGAGDRLVEHRGEVRGDRVRQHEVAVGQALHQRRGAEAVGAVVGEVGLAGAVQAGDRGHQLVVDPQPAHRVVAGRVDAHRRLVRVLVGDALVHLEQVAVALLDDVLAETVDRLGEVEVHAVLQRADAAPGVDCTLGGARRDVARGEVAEARVQPLEVVVALVLGDLRRGALVAGHLAAPTPGRRCAATRSSA